MASARLIDPCVRGRRASRRGILKAHHPGVGIRPGRGTAENVGVSPSGAHSFFAAVLVSAASVSLSVTGPSRGGCGDVGSWNTLRAGLDGEGAAYVLAIFT